MALLSVAVTEDDNRYDVSPYDKVEKVLHLL